MSNCVLSCSAVSLMLGCVSPSTKGSIESRHPSALRIVAKVSRCRVSSLERIFDRVSGSMPVRLATSATPPCASTTVWISFRKKRCIGHQFVFFYAIGGYSIAPHVCKVARVQITPFSDISLIILSPYVQPKFSRVGLFSCCLICHHHRAKPIVVVKFYQIDTITRSKMET